MAGQVEEAIFVDTRRAAQAGVLETVAVEEVFLPEVAQVMRQRLLSPDVPPPRALLRPALLSASAAVTAVCGADNMLARLQEVMEPIRDLQQQQAPMAGDGGLRATWTLWAQAVRAAGGLLMRGGGQGGARVWIWGTDLMAFGNSVRPPPPAVAAAAAAAAGAGGIAGEDGDAGDLRATMPLPPDVLFEDEAETEEEEQEGGKEAGFGQKKKGTGGERLTTTGCYTDHLSLMQCIHEFAAAVAAYQHEQPQQQQQPIEVKIVLGVVSAALNPHASKQLHALIHDADTALQQHAAQRISIELVHNTRPEYQSRFRRWIGESLGGVSMALRLPTASCGVAHVQLHLSLLSLPPTPLGDRQRRAAIFHDGLAAPTVLHRVPLCDFDIAVLRGTCWVVAPPEPSEFASLDEYLGNKAMLHELCVVLDNDDDGLLLQVENPHTQLTEYWLFAPHVAEPILHQLAAREHILHDSPPLSSQQEQQRQQETPRMDHQQQQRKEREPAPLPAPPVTVATLQPPVGNTDDGEEHAVPIEIEQPRRRTASGGEQLSALMSAARSSASTDPLSLSATAPSSSSSSSGSSSVVAELEHLGIALTPASVQPHCVADDTEHQAGADDGRSYVSSLSGNEEFPKLSAARKEEDAAPIMQALSRGIIEQAVEQCPRRSYNPLDHGSNLYQVLERFRRHHRRLPPQPQPQPQPLSLPHQQQQQQQHARTATSGLTLKRFTPPRRQAPLANLSPNVVAQHPAATVMTAAAAATRMGADTASAAAASSGSGAATQRRRKRQALNQDPF